MMINFRAILLDLLTISVAACQLERNCKEATLSNVQQIDAGAGQVVAVDSNHQVFHLHGSIWYTLSGLMQHVTVGPAGIWGVDRQGYVSKIVAGEWTRTLLNRMHQVDAGGDQFVTAAGPMRGLFITGVCVTRPDAVSFMRPDTNFVYKVWIVGVSYYSCGPYACWVLNHKGEVFVTKVDPKTCKGSDSYVHKVDGSLVMVEVATDGSVYGVNSEGDIFRRNGVSTEKPEGTSWTKVDMFLSARHVSFDLGILWVVTRSGKVLECIV